MRMEMKAIVITLASRICYDSVSVAAAAAWGE